MTKDQFADVILQHNRSAAGDSAPAEGLYLTKVEYSLDLFL
jgi:tRNA U38,U39,U40 pseudouridine synthase TruA